MDDDREQDAIRGFTHDAKFLRQDQLAVELDALAHLSHRLFTWPPRRQNFVLLGQTVPRVHDPIRDFSVIGEQQEPFGVPIKSTNGE